VRCAATERARRRHEPTRVADEPGISYETVANTKWRMRDKLDLRKTADLIRFYLDAQCWTGESRFGLEQGIPEQHEAKARVGN
jgi:hypothetical protein